MPGQQQAVTHAESVARMHASLTAELEAYSTIHEASEETEALERGFYYHAYRSTEGGTVHVRRRRLPDGSRGPNEVVLDVNLLTRQWPYVHIGVMHMSPDPHQRFVAFTLDARGDEDYSLRIQRVGERRSIVDIPHVVNAVWAPYIAGTPMSLLVTLADSKRRAHAACRLTLGSRELTELLRCDDETRWVDVHVSKDGTLATIVVETRDETDVYLVPQGSDTQALQRVQHASRKRFYVTQHARTLHVVSRGSSGDVGDAFELSACSLQQTTPQPPLPAGIVVSERGCTTMMLNCRSLLPEGYDATLEDVDMFDAGIVMYGRVGLTPIVDVLHHDGSLHRVKLGVPTACSVIPGTNSDSSSPTARLSIQCTTSAAAEYDLTIATGQLTCVSTPRLVAPPVRPLHHAEELTSYVIHAPSTADARIPITVVHSAACGIHVDVVREAAAQLCDSGWPALTAALYDSAYTDWSIELRGQHNTSRSVLEMLANHAPARRMRATLERASDQAVHVHAHDWQHNNPTIMRAYGAYGFPLDASFNPAWMPLLARGFVLAHAHVRGGGDFGAAWYTAGRAMSKMNTLHDAVACAGTLILSGLTRASLLATRTESAGALIGAHLANEHPSLCAAHVLNVPFLSVIETMTDATLPLTQPEYIEWGQPDTPGVQEYMRGYDPMCNVRRQPYPAMIALAAEADVRAPPSQALQFMELVKQHDTISQSEDDRLLCHVRTDGGHSGPGSADAQRYCTALEHAFILRHLGLRMTDDSGASVVL